MRLFKKILLLALLLLAGVAGVIAWKIGPRNVIGMLRYDQRRDGDLKVGDRAPDAMLVSLDGRGRQQLLASAGSKPLVLVFGSFT
ncbi:MAG TPA: hypothetical protein VMU84_12270 [Thermoanaerobaculia bacterium]|nr:hypothetical protein [Thermoanaerobaculia bacterium]